MLYAINAIDVNQEGYIDLDDDEWDDLGDD